MGTCFLYPLGITLTRMNLKTWIALTRGRSLSLAAALDVPPSFVSRMAAGLKPIPVEHMTAIEAFTKGEVTRQEMCPDRWRHIWPELATDNTPEAQQPRAQAGPDVVADGGV